MPVYTLQGPDGKTYKVEGPEGATEEQLGAFIKSAGVGSTPQQGPQPSAIGVGEKIGQGLRDPIDAGAQLLTHVLPDSVVQAGNKFNNWLADKTGLVAKLPEGGVDQQIADQEKDYQSRRMAAGESGMDGWRAVGNIASPANLAVGAVAAPARGASLMARLLSGGASGAAMGVAQPVTEGDFWTEKTKQAGIGAATGGVVSGVAAAAGRVINPNTRQNVKTLLDEGVTPTPGQILGGRWQVAEDKLTSVPVLGDAIANSRSRGLDEFNKAAYARALAPVNGSVPAEAGRDAVASVRTQLADAYDNLLPKLTFAPDQQFTAELTNLRNLVSGLPKQQAERFENILQTQLTGKSTPAGLMSGESLKQVESELGRLSRGLRGDASFDNRELGSAVGELQNLIRQNLQRSNPQYADELAKINSGYANYARIRDAASRQGSAEGRFTPAQLSAAVRGQDRTVGKRAFSEGDALMQDLSDAGKDVLASKYPDSGSIGRLLMGIGTAGGVGAVSPTTLAGGGVAALPYLPGGRQLAAALLARRPVGAENAAEAVRRYIPYLTPAAIPNSNGAQ